MTNEASPPDVPKPRAYVAPLAVRKAGPAVRVDATGEALKGYFGLKARILGPVLLGPVLIFVGLLTGKYVWALGGDLVAALGLIVFAVGMFRAAVARWSAWRTLAGRMF